MASCRSVSMKRTDALALGMILGLFVNVLPANAGPAVAAGAKHVVVLTDAGTLWVWGFNGWGQLGDGTFTSRTTPKALTSITGVTAVAAGGNSTWALKTDGTVWAWGDNSY